MAKFYKYSCADGVQVWSFANGAKVEFEVARVSEEIAARLVEHGARQKITDSFAGCSKEQDFSGAVANAERVVESLYAGEWKLSGNSTTDLVSALSEVLDITEEDAEAIVAKADDEQMKKLTSNKAVRGVMARIKWERLKGSASTDAADELRKMLK